MLGMESQTLFTLIGLKVSRKRKTKNIVPLNSSRSYAVETKIAWFIAIIVIYLPRSSLTRADYFPTA